jgi:antitoxin component YwqK of YwqJK toxin-antitoxin module
MKRASQGYAKSVFEDVKFKITNIAAVNLKHDVCVLYLGDANGTPLPTAKDVPVPGDEILVGGNPEGLEASFSKGIVSGIRPESGLFQIDAPISPGSSGGPVVNDRGEVIGLAVSSMVEGQNLNFAVPIRYLVDQAVGFKGLNVDTVGHLAVSDRENEGFHGIVKSFVGKASTYTLNEASGSYIEGPALAWEAEIFNQNGMLEESTKYSDGAQTGKILREYSENGLEEREIEVNTDGSRQVHELHADEEVTVPASRIHFNETVEEGVKGDYAYAVCKYDGNGNRTECSVPAQGAKYVMKYDENDREVEWLVYAEGKLRGDTHFTYEDNKYGDWIKQHATLWNSAKPDAGFIPLGESYRDVTYYGAGDR